MLTFSTHDLAPRDRFDHWRDVRGKGLFGVTIELPRERRLAFQGSFTSFMAGDAIACEMQASAYRVTRSESDIARVAGDSLCISVQVRGPGALQTGGGRVMDVRDGDMIINHSDLAYTGTPATDNAFHFKLLKIPLHDELTLGQPVHDLYAERSVQVPSLVRPLRALFDVLMNPSQFAADPGRDVVNIARLALLMRGRLKRNAPEVRSAFRSGMLHIALEIMAREKASADLGPAIVATKLGVSLRQLHSLFEDAEMTFSRTLTAMRLEEGKRLLGGFPEIPVVHVANACGFDSLATFYRTFSKAFGMSPGAWRTGAGTS